MTNKRNFKELSDIEKLQKQWHKLTGLHTREEWSAAIVRAATAAEIAANHAIRSEFSSRSDFNSEFVNSLLKWSNGLAGKLQHLLKPLSVGNPDKEVSIKRLCDIADIINKKRNAIVHQGEFCNEDEAVKIISTTQEFITTLIKHYDPEFKLIERV